MGVCPICRRHLVPTSAYSRQAPKITISRGAPPHRSYIAVVVSDLITGGDRPSGEDADVRIPPGVPLVRLGVGRARVVGELIIRPLPPRVNDDRSYEQHEVERCVTASRATQPGTRLNPQPRHATLQPACQRSSAQSRPTRAPFQLSATRPAARIASATSAVLAHLTCAARHGPYYMLFPRLTHSCGSAHALAQVQLRFSPASRSVAASWFRLPGVYTFQNPELGVRRLHVLTTRNCRGSFVYLWGRSPG